MAAIRIELFGGFKVTVGEETHTRFRTQKAAHLLAYLSLQQGARVSREILAETLWPEADPDVGRSRLKQELATVRREIELPAGGAQLFHADRNSIYLDPTAASIDVAEFERLTESARTTEDERERAWMLVQACELYRGEFLPGCLDDWALQARERLALAHIDACLSASENLQASGDLDGAVTYAQRAVSADPLREESHVRLMRIYLAQGRAANAIRQFRELETVLRNELDAEPGAEALALFRSCANGGHELRATADRPPGDRQPLRPSESSARGPDAISALPTHRRRTRLWQSALAAACLAAAFFAGTLVPARRTGNAHVNKPAEAPKPFVPYVDPPSDRLAPIPRYSIIDLGTLPGTERSEATGINNESVAVGLCVLKDNHQQAFRWDTARGMVRLHVPKLYDFTTSAISINDRGEIGGDVGEGRTRRAVRWDAAGRPTIIPPLYGGWFSAGGQINARGDVTGCARKERIGTHAFLWRPDGSLIDIGVLPEFPPDDRPTSLGTGINKLGEVVGWTATEKPGPEHAFVWDPHVGMQGIGTLPDGTFSRAEAINSSGQIVGQADGADGDKHPIIYYRVHGMRALRLHSPANGMCDAINDSGTVIGHLDHPLRAFVWDSRHGFHDLNDCIPPNSGWVLERAEGLNDRGQIVGKGLHGGLERAFLLSPMN